MVNKKNIDNEILNLKKFNKIAAGIQAINAISQLILSNKFLSKKIFKTEIPSKWKFPIQKTVFYNKYQENICFGLDSLNYTFDEKEKKDVLDKGQLLYYDLNHNKGKKYGIYNTTYKEYIYNIINGIINRENISFIIQLDKSRINNAIKDYETYKDNLNKELRKTFSGLENIFITIIINEKGVNDERIFEFNGIFGSYNSDPNIKKLLSKLGKDNKPNEVDISNQKEIEKIVEEYLKVKQNSDSVKGNSFFSSSQTKKVCVGKNGGISLSYTMCLFSALTCFSHLYLVFNFQKYKKWIEIDQIQYARWIEYSITSSIMVSSLAGIAGITSIEELIPIFLLSSVTNILGLGIESTKPNKKINFKNIRKILFLAATITHSYPWYRIFSNFLGLLNNISENKSSLEKCSIDPYKTEDKEVKKKYQKIKDLILDRLDQISGFSPLIKTGLIGLFVIYFSFPINMLNQYFRNSENIETKNYIKGEKRYIILSMVAKSFLSWVLFLASFRNPKEDVDICYKKN